MLIRAQDDRGTGGPADWTPFKLADGSYISTRWIRSAIDFRLTLGMDDGTDRWWLGFLIAGD